MKVKLVHPRPGEGHTVGDVVDYPDHVAQGLVDGGIAVWPDRNPRRKSTDTGSGRRNEE